MVTSTVNGNIAHIQAIMLALPSRCNHGELQTGQGIQQLLHCMVSHVLYVCTDVRRWTTSELKHQNLIPRSGMENYIYLDRLSLSEPNADLHGTCDMTARGHHTSMCTQLRLQDSRHILPVWPWTVWMCDATSTYNVWLYAPNVAPIEFTFMVNTYLSLRECTTRRRARILCNGFTSYGNNKSAGDLNLYVLVFTRPQSLSP